MKILVISDTHIGQRIPTVPDFLADLMNDFDYVIHAGDITSYEALEIFEANEGFIAVCGNMDSSLIKSELPASRVVNLGGYDFGIAHGWGPPIELSRRILERYFAGLSLDVLIYGHTHHPEIRKSGDLLILNPGSISGNYNSNMVSYLTISLSDNEIIPKIQCLDRDQVSFW